MWLLPQPATTARPFPSPPRPLLSLMKSLAGEALQEPLVGRKVSDVVWEEQKLGGNLEKR